MKILHVGKFYAPVKGGIESTSKYIVDSLKDDENRVVCFNSSKRNTTDIVDNIPIFRASTFATISSQPISINYLRLIKEQFNDFKPDIVHFHYPNPLGALYLLLSIPKDCKLVVHWHSDIVAQQVLRYTVRPIEKWLTKRADAIVTTSPLYAPYSSSLRGFENKITVIASAIDEKKYSKDSECDNRVNFLRQRYGKPIVFFIGRHVKYKGIIHLLESTKFILNDCHIVIAGTGPLTYELKSKYQSDNITWVGKISDSEVRDYMYAADIFAFPSITRNEAFGLVLAEAMYCYNPAVTFSIKGSGVNWVSINEFTGLEVANSDSEKFGKAIDKLLENNELREKYGQQAHERVVNNYLMNIVGPQYKNLYNKLVYENQK